MSRLITSSELPKWVPGQVLCASDELGWKGVALRSYGYRGLDVAVPAMQDFMIVGYRRGATRMERRFEGVWTKTECTAGDMSLLSRSQESHWYWTDDIDVSHVYLSESLVSNVATEVMDRSVSEVQLHDVLKVRDPIVTAIVEAITAEAGQRSIGSAMYAEALGTQLAIHLLRRYASVRFREPSDVKGLSPLQCRRVTEYIDSRLNESLSLEELAKVAGMGVWSFSRHFRETFGRAPHAYVIDQRIARAQRLLTQGVLPVKAIASACGFSDQAHMTRVFQSRLHITPAAARRNIKAGLEA
jgi:AraC family transcriptional regulator